MVNSNDGCIDSIDITNKFLNNQLFYFIVIILFNLLGYQWTN